MEIHGWDRLEARSLLSGKHRMRASVPQLPVSDISFLPEDPRHPPHLAVSEPDLDPMRVEGGVRQDLFHHSLGPLPRPLVLLEDYLHLQPLLYILSVLPVHDPPFSFRCELQRPWVLEVSKTVPSSSRRRPLPYPSPGLLDDSLRSGRYVDGGFGRGFGTRSADSIDDAGVGPEDSRTQ